MVIFCILCYKFIWKLTFRKFIILTNSIRLLLSGNQFHSACSNWNSTKVLYFSIHNCHKILCPRNLPRYFSKVDQKSEEMWSKSTILCRLRSLMNWIYSCLIVDLFYRKSPKRWDRFKGSLDHKIWQHKESVRVHLSKKKRKCNCISKCNSNAI